MKGKTHLTEEHKDLESYEASTYRSKNVDSVVTIISVSHILTAIVSIPIIYFIFMDSPGTGPVLYIFLTMLAGAALVVAIPLYVIIGLAIWKVQGWSWRVAVIVNVMFLLFNIATQIILLAMLDVVLLLALNNSDVRNALQPYQ